MVQALYTMQALWFGPGSVCVTYCHIGISVSLVAAVAAIRVFYTRYNAFMYPLKNDLEPIQQPAYMDVWWTGNACLLGP